MFFFQNLCKTKMVPLRLCCEEPFKPLIFKCTSEYFCLTPLLKNLLKYHISALCNNHDERLLTELYSQPKTSVMHSKATVTNRMIADHEPNML